MVKSFPYWLKKFPLNGKKFPSLVKKFPLHGKKFPSLVKNFPAIVKRCYLFDGTLDDFAGLQKCEI